MKNYFVLAVTVLLFCTVCTVPAVVEATNNASKTKSETSKRPTIGQLDKKYKEVFKTLSDDQKNHLKGLEKEQVKALEPLFIIDKNVKAMEGCSALDPSWNSRLTLLVQKSRFAHLNEYERRKGEFRNLKSKVDFINSHLLNAHLQLSSRIQQQLMKGMSDIYRKTIISKKSVEQCVELEQKLRKETADVEIIKSQKPISFNIARDNLTGAITSCGLSFGKTLESSSRVTFSKNFRSENGRSVLDFSAKVFSPQGKALPVEDLWVDFGNVNTRTVARLTRPGEELRIATLPSSYIFNLLKSLRHSNIILGVKSSNWPEVKLIEMPTTGAEDLAGFANCAAAVEPRLVDDLLKEGFDIKPDERHEKGKKAAARNNKLRYKTSTMPGTPGVVSGCIWTMSFDAIGKKDLGAALITSGTIAPNNRYNNQSVFWILGTDNGARINLEKVQISTTDPSTGKILSNADFQVETTPGERYEMRMPYEAHSKWVAAISQSGINLKAREVGSNDLLEATLPPPQSIATKNYKDCISKITEPQ